jgi:hypothetical protein
LPGGERYEGPVELTLLHEETGGVLLTTEEVDIVPAFMRRTGLRPGVYTLHVDAPGYVPWVRRGIRLDEPGASAGFDVLLQPDPAYGYLELQLAYPARPPSAVDVHVLTRASSFSHEGDGWGEHEATATADDEETRGYVVGPLPAGAHAVLVWPTPWYVGFLADVDVVEGETVTVTIPVVRGVRAELSKLLPPPEAGEDALVFVALRSQEFGDLPRIRFDQNQPFSIGIGGGSQPVFPLRAGPRVRRDAVLGPYPFADLVLEHLNGDEGGIYPVSR